MSSRDTQNQSYLLFLVRFGLYALLFTPLVFSSLFYQPYVAPKWLFIVATAEITFFLYVWFIAFHQEWRPHFGVVAKIFFIYLAILALSSVFGIDFLTSFWGSAERDISLLVWLHLAVIFLMTTTVFRTKRDWELFALISLCIALVVSLIHVFPVLSFDLLARPKGGATLGNSSFLGTYLLFQIFFAAFVATSSRDWVRLFGVVTLVILIGTLFSTTAYAAILSFLGGVVLFGLLLLIFYGRGKVFRALGIGLIIVLGLAFFWVFFLALLPDSSLHAFISVRTSPARFALWDIAWTAFKERPILGWGLENFRYVFLQFYNPCFGSSSCGGEIWFDRAHNQFLDVLIQSGLVGLMAFLSMFSALLITLWKLTKEHVLSGVMSALTIALFGAYLAQNLTVFDTATSVLFFVFVLGLVSSLQKKKEMQKENLHSAFFFFPIIVTFVLPISFFFFVIQPARAYFATAAAVSELKMSLRIPLYEQAVTLSRAGEDLRRSLLAAQTATVVWDLNVEQRIQGRKWFERELAFARGGLLSTIKESPNYLRAYLDLGLIELTSARYYDQSRYKNAEAILLQALELNQTNPLPYWGLVMVYLDQGMVEQALPLADAALALDPQVSVSHLRRVIAYLFSKDEDLIETKIQESLAVFPSLAKNIERLSSKNIESNKSLLLIQFYYDIDPANTEFF